MTSATRLRDAYSHQPTGALPAIQSILYLIVVAIFIVGFCLQPYRIPSGSMEPTLLIGDFLLVDKQLVPIDSHGPLPSTAVHHGDIIVFHYPLEPATLLVKRVVGLPGDHIHLRNGHVYRNGTLQDEPYAIYRASAPDSFRDNFPRMFSAEPGIDSRWWIEMRHLVDHGDLVVPPNSFFVLGDNRNDSEDSRYWGFVPRSAIIGKPFLVYFSLAEPERDDPSPTPELAPPLHTIRYQRGLLDRIFELAHWDRTLHIIR